MPKIKRKAFNEFEAKDKIFSQELFWAAIKADDATYLSDLDLKKQYLTIQDADGFNALHIAVIFQRENMVHWLLSQSCQLEIPCIYQWTALHLAAHGPSENIAQALIVAGANILAKDTLGWTPLHIAIQTGNLKIAQKFIEYCPTAIHCASNDGSYPFELADNLKTQEDI